VLGWDTFAVIIGGAAGTLIGLLFVAGLDPDRRHLGVAALLQPRW
jgi:hypothetical protein